MKTFKRFFASLMVAVMVLTAAPLSGFVGMELNLDWLSFDWLDFNTKASAATYNGTCGENLTWTLDTSTGELIISGEGEMTDYSSYSSVPWYSYRSSIEKVTIGNGVTSIGNYAFYYCTNLTSITIPYSVTSIGDDAFSYCTSLTSITIGNGVTSIGSYVFEGCTSLTSITIPESVTSIGNGAFYICSSLTSITIPDSVTSIGANAFGDCTGLTSFTIPDSVTSISYCAFSYCTSLTSITIPESVTSIDDGAFYECTSLTSIAIPDSVTSIGSSAFSGCKSLTNITIPDSVTSIGNYAFQNCSGLADVSIGNGVTSIGYSAFEDCMSLIDVYYTGTQEQWNAITVGSGNDSLTSATIHFIQTGKCGDNLTWSLDTTTGELVISGTGEMIDYYYEVVPWNDYISSIKAVIIYDGVANIGKCAFSGCANLTSVTIPDSVTSIGSYAFDDCKNLADITIPNGVTDINHRAFGGCSSLISVTIGNGVTSIGSQAFSWCSSLTNIIIPDSVTGIGYQAFSSCTNLTSITIGNGVKSIGDNAFENCSSIEKVYYTGTKVEWDSIVLGYWHGLPLYKVILECNSERPYYNSGKCGDDIDWILYADGELVISGTGEMYNYDYYSDGDYTPWRDYHELIENVTISNGVANIGACTFEYCSSLTNITIPDSVTSIGDYAFRYCDSLTSITIPDSVTSVGYYAFDGCVNLTDVYYTGEIAGWCGINYRGDYSNPMCYSDNLYIQGALLTGEFVIPDGVEKIGNYAFLNCTEITSVIIPDSVSYIGYSTFEGCTGITEVTMPISAEIRYDSFSFYGCNSIKKVILTKGNGTVVDYDSGTGYAPWNNSSCSEVIIEEGVIGIGDNMFEYCTHITSITISNSVTSIGNYAFSYCTSLTSITIPDNVTSISDGAFYNCTSLANIENSDRVTRIGSYSFSGCTSLTSIAIPGSVESIGKNAFSNCKNLEEVIFNGDSIIEFGEEVFYSSPKAMICCEENSWLHFYASSNGMRFCLLDDSKIPTFEIKNNVLVSYRGASENVSVSIVNQIGYGAFEGNSTVEHIEIAKSVNVIYNNAFKNCSALKSVYIPQSVTSIGATAFNGCDDVTIWCYAGSYADEYAQTHNIDVEYITLSIDNSIIYLAPNEQTKVTYSLNTHLADNMSVVWESTDKTIVTVDSFGNIKGIKAGTAVVVVASKDGTMRDYCVVKVVGIEALSSLSIDFDSGIISGLYSNTKSLDGLITMTDSSCNLSYTTLGTDSIVYVERDNEIVDAYTILIYGDVNGDSWYDGQDAIIVDCLANGMLTKDDVGEAVYMAADCNHDGVIDGLDVALLNQAGTLLANVDQTKPTEVLLETSSEYVEYISLIDQSPEIEDETDTPEADLETEDTTPEQDANKETNFFEMIMNFIKAIIEKILSRIPVPYK